MSVRRRKEPIHKIFYICSQLTPDPTWKDFLNQCSFGYFPSSVKFNKGNLVSTRKKNTFTIQIPEDPEKALPVLISIFRDKLGIKSVKEKKSENLVFQERMQELVFESWTNVKTKAGKKSLLSNFVESLSDYYCMDYNERIKTLSLLELCVSQGYINKKHIHVSKGMITKIDNFYFDPSNRQPFYTGKIPTIEIDLIPVPIFYDQTKQIIFNY